jgi:hypothetical protein
VRQPSLPFAVTPKGGITCKIGTVEEEQEAQGLLMGAMSLFLSRSIVKDKQFKKVKSSLAGLGLNTVCEEAKCPNVGEVATPSSSTTSSSCSFRIAMHFLHHCIPLIQWHRLETDGREPLPAVLGRGEWNCDGDNHADGRHLHPRLQVL